MTATFDRSANAANGRFDIEVRSPADGRFVGAVPDMTAADVHAVAQRLRAAQPAWEAIGFDGRRAWLERFRDWILDNEDRLLGLVQDETGRPTVLLDVDESMACMTEETFGPTLPIVKVADVDEAVRRANDSKFGLAASVFTKDHAKGRAVAERIDSSSVNVNNVMTNVFQLSVPFGGRRDSGAGARHGGAYGIRKYCWSKSIIEERFNLPSEIYWYPTKAKNIRLMNRAARFIAASDWKRRLNRR